MPGGPDLLLTWLNPGITQEHRGDRRDNFTSLCEDQRCNRSSLLEMKFRIILLEMEEKENQEIPQSEEIFCFLGAQMNI